jgi:hypothetical protein
VARGPAEIAATLGELVWLDLVELGQEAVLERIVQAAATCCGSTGGVQGHEQGKVGERQSLPAATVIACCFSGAAAPHRALGPPQPVQLRRQRPGAIFQALPVAVAVERPTVDAARPQRQSQLCGVQGRASSGLGQQLQLRPLSKRAGNGCRRSRWKRDSRPAGLEGWCGAVLRRCRGSPLSADHQVDLDGRAPRRHAEAAVLPAVGEDHPPSSLRGQRRQLQPFQHPLIQEAGGPPSDGTSSAALPRPGDGRCRRRRIETQIPRARTPSHTTVRTPARASG